MGRDDIVKGTTCFGEHAKLGLTCQKESCKYWISNEDSLNCAIISSQDGTQTLQSIGSSFGITRMRVCQIEKMIMRKLKIETEEAVITSDDLSI